jgi:hypothetical protein
MSTSVLEQPPVLKGKDSWERAVAKAQQLAAEGVRGVVLTRSLEAIIKCVEAADSQKLQEIASSPTNYEVLLRQLTGCLDVLRGEDSLADARLRGLKMKEDLLKRAGGAMNADQVGKLLNLTRQAVDKRRKARKLVAIEFGKRGYLYPGFQFDEPVIDLVEQILDRIDSRIEDWSLLAFFLNGNAYLNGASPVEAMRQGKEEEVLRAAQAYGSQGAA